MAEEQIIANNKQFKAYLVIFGMVGAQAAIGLAVFQRFVYMEAKQDGIFVVLLAGLYTHLTLYIMIKTLRRFGNRDLYDVHRIMFGTWIGKVLNFIYILYFFCALLVTTSTYYEILATYMFPEVPNWFVASILIILTFYTVMGGIRVVMGLAFFSVAISFPSLLVLYQVFHFFDIHNFLPLFEAPPVALLKGIYQMALSLVGFELLYIYYPYIQDKEKTQRYAQIGAFVTNTYFFALMVLAIGFFGGKEIIKSAWPSLSLYKIVKFPFLEQYQVIVLCVMLLSVMPILCLYMWSLTKGLKRNTKLTQKNALYVMCAMLFVGTLFFQTRVRVYTLGLYFNQVSFYIGFVYPYVLFMLSFFLGRKKR